MHTRYFVGLGDPLAAPLSLAPLSYDAAQQLAWASTGLFKAAHSHVTRMCAVTLTK